MKNIIVLVVLLCAVPAFAVDYQSVYAGATIDSGIAKANTAVQPDATIATDGTDFNKLNVGGTINNATSLYGAVAVTTTHTGTATNSQAFAVTPTLSPTGASISNFHGTKSAPIVKTGVAVTSVNSYVGSGSTDATNTGNITTWNIYNAGNVTKSGSGTLTNVNAFYSVVNTGTNMANFNGLVITNLSAGITGSAKAISTGMNTTGVEDRWNLHLSGTAHNHIAGNVLIGSVTETAGAEKLQVTGNALVTGTVAVASGTNVVYYCNGGTNAGLLGRGNAGPCSGGAWVATSLKLD